MTSAFHSRTIGPLDCIEKKGNEDGPWVVMFHGYGADAQDLAPLASVIAASPGTNWLFPNGPISVPIGPYHHGRAWFPIDMEAIERAMMSGSHRDMSRTRPDGLDTARIRAEEMLASLGVPLERIVLGGFSQGAMLATELSLQRYLNPRAMILLSGTLLDRDHWGQLASGKREFPYYQCHGTTDAILSYKLAVELHELLSGSGLRGTFTSFQGGHEIPQMVISEVGQFLRSVR